MVLGLAAWSLPAQEESVIRAAMYLSGAASEEEIPADLPERLEAAAVVRINNPHLRANLLISDYQAASIRDYRAVYGDILSAEELALVDGFGPVAAAALAPFLSFTSYRLPGQADTVRTRATALLRGALTTLGGKLKAGGEVPRAGITWQAGGAWRRDGVWRAQADGSGKADGSFYADATLGPWRLLAGHFNARWGQGLAAWSGFSMESLSTLDAFLKRPTGLSPVWSYAPSGVHRGVALSYDRAHIRAAGYIGQHNDYGLHADYLSRTAQLGITALWADATGCTLALDGRLTSRHALLTAELACRSRSVAFKTAASGRWNDSWKWAAQARALPRRFTGKKYGEYGAALGLAYASRRAGNTASSTATTHRGIGINGGTGPAGGADVTGLASATAHRGTGINGGTGPAGGTHTASLTVDASLLPIPGTDPRRIQIRIYSQWQWQITPSWLLDTRVTERYRNYESPRTSLRADLKFTSAPASASASAPYTASVSPAYWLLTARLEAVRCSMWGFLTYVEGGRKNESSALYLRVTGFSIPVWDARIYCYERDAPGTFSVPSYNGRGIAFSAVGSLKLRPFRNLSQKHPLRFFSLKGNLRAACQLRTDRRPSYTLALQLQTDL